VVEESLRGAGESLKESVIARELYNKGPDFDTASDPVVRVDARRLRDKLREYYAEFRRDPVHVSVPKGRYAAVFEWNPDARGPVLSEIPLRMDAVELPPPAETRRRPRIWIAASLILIALIEVSVWILRRGPAAPAPVPVPLTTYAGSEGPPSLSPDGQFVVFDWTGTAQPAVPQIYIKDVHGEALRQLTEGLPAVRPAWSPDGRYIAFVRPTAPGVFLISPLGGPEQKISDSGTHVGWTSDSRSVLIRDRPPGAARGTKPFGIYRVSLETRERQQITHPTEGVGDWVFSVSPDGGTLAFARYGLPGVADVYVVAISGGEPRRLTNWASGGISVAWTPDGREVVYSVHQPQGGRLWRIPWNVRTPGRGTALAGQTGEANFVSISRPGADRPARLAYQVENLDIGMRLVDLTAVSGGTFTSVHAVADSTRAETAAVFSPDAGRVAFASDRSGPKEVWVCNRDGSDPVQITSLAGPNTLPAGWAPDGRTFLLQATINGNSDIYTMPANGGSLKRLTWDPFLHVSPSWSRDGKWIYFASSRSDTVSPGVLSQIWRIPAEGGNAVQLTAHGGFFPRESFDRRFIYFLARPHVTVFDKSDLMRMPVEGGEPVKLLADVRGSLWGLTAEGILFLTRDGRVDTVNLYRFDTGKTASLGNLPFPISGVGSAMTVSEDGRWLLTNQLNRHDTDLMLIENFK
jgi:Tol biopolymer transport system component